MIETERLANDVTNFLESCSTLAYSPQRAALGEIAVQRVIGALFDGDIARLARWYRAPRDEDEREMSDILHAACHAVARGFEIDDPARLSEALWVLDVIECEVSSPKGRRTCCHQHPLGVRLALSKTA